MEPYRFVRILVRYRRPAAAIFAVSVLISLAACFLLPPRYASGFLILSPDGGGNPLLKTLNKGMYDSGIKGWVLPAVLQSEDLAIDVLTAKFTVWTRGAPREMSIALIAGTNDRRKLLRAARRYIRVSVDEVHGSVRVTVETPHPELSCKVADYALSRLDSYAATKRRELREESGEYYGARIVEARRGLVLAEADLVEFLGANRGWLESDDPGTRMELQRLQRKQEIYSGVYFELHKQREMDDLKAMSMVRPLEVLDRPSVPTLKSFPRRKIVLMAGMLIGAILAVASAFLLELNRLRPSL